MSSPDEQEFPGHILHQASLWDNDELILDLLNGDLITHINSQDSWGRTALHAAATTDDSKCLKILLKAGANPNIRSGAQDNFKTPLHTAAEHGFLNNVRILVESGADTSACDGNGYSSLELAERGSHTAAYEYLKNTAVSKEEAIQSLHYALREAVCSSETLTVQNLFKDIERSEKETIVNMTPNGTNTLLFKACESGNKILVEILLESGADGRIHPVTKYSPLYIACYYGHKDIVSILLKKFPTLVQVPTVEKWLALHACCINGHVNILEMLLKFEYPQEILITFRLFSGDFEYEMPFDINLKDVSGQNAMYIACQMGNQRLVDVLLKHRVEVRKLGDPRKLIATSESVTNLADSEKQTSPTKRRVSEGIQGIISRLSIVTNQNLISAKKLENMVCPVDVNTLCEDYQTPLHVAVKQRSHAIATMLLNAKADPNIPILPSPSSVTGSFGSHHSHHHHHTNQELRGKQRKEESSTALVEACLQRDLGMIELLLKFGARDDDCKAVAIVSRDDVIVGKILALKAHQDPENKINISYMNEFILQKLKKPLISSSILPSSPVNINWHNQKLDHVSEQWLISAALRINPRLRLSPKSQILALQAITRLDLSSNSNFEKIPQIIWSMCSLKSLNLSHCKIREIEISQNNLSAVWLEEILLQENQLESVPGELITSFPSLKILNLSNNKLQAIPSAVWLSQTLEELDLSLNLLTELPAISSGMEVSMFDSLPYLSLANSPEEEGPKSPDFVMVEFGKNREKLCRISPDSGQHHQQAQPIIIHHALWRQNIHVVTNQELSQKSFYSGSLLSLNVSHNSFHKIPKVLACLAPNLQRLNASYNNLKFMGHIAEYPIGLKSLDLSHNQIEKWFYSPGDKVNVKLSCYGPENSPIHRSPGGERCIHKRHVKLDNLKTFLATGNKLNSISVQGDDLNSGGIQEDLNSDGLADPLGRKTPSQGKNLWFPALTMMDVSSNCIREVPSKVAELTSLSVLNLSGNNEIQDLPPELGLLNRMWNLNLNGCNLQEPLKSMIESKRCKTMDMIGYLKSVLEDAKTYSRMKLMVVGIQGIGKTSLLHQLRQEGNQKHASQDHWARRMGAANKIALQKSGKTISTVGVDIGSWVWDGKGQKTSSYGPVTFRTWDFGGQKEYYATHVYFLSRRSLYLVVWNICDGEKGLNEIVQWLVNIQARAPNSPVIIVGTHFDLVSEKFPPGYLDYLQQKIRDRFICISDPEKRGLPKVLFSVEISCKTKHNIRHLCNIIYESVFNIKTSTGKRLLEQKIPSKYIHLEEIIAYLATDRKSKGLDPVLTEQEFKTQVSEWLDKGFGLKFRDDAEIMQAIMFLHEQGTCLHYEDSTLRDLYFLDPQWLCDMLAHVVTVREINPFAKNGIMKNDDLLHIFKGQTSETRDYVLSLLGKFELAVPFDNVRLLIPSLLPSFDQMKMGFNEVRVRVPVRSRGWALKNRVNRMSRHLSEDSIKSLSSPASELRSPSMETFLEDGTNFFSIEKGTIPAINRFLLLSYFPSGFWPRLISRILSDDRIVEIIRNYFNPPHSTDITQEVVKVLDQKAEWCCWQNGMELKYGDLIIIRIKEISGEKPYSFMLRRDDGALCESDACDNSNNDGLFLKEDSTEQVWDAVDLTETGLLEIHMPARTVVVNCLSEALSPSRISSSSKSKESTLRKVTLEPSIESISKLLALTVDHVDLLLEDFYPSIGTRFVHTSEGKYLVTRLIPCPHCFPSEDESLTDSNDGRGSRSSKENDKTWPGSSTSGGVQRPDVFKIFGFGLGNKSPRMSSDSGVGNSPTNTRVSSVDSNIDGSGTFGKDQEEKLPGGILLKTGSRMDGFGKESYTSGLNYFLKGQSGNGRQNAAMYSWSVEYCILHGQKFFEFDSNKSFDGGDGTRIPNQIGVKCPKHGEILLKEIAPDILFLDLNSRYLLGTDDIQRGKLLGRGAFGFVFSGKLIPKHDTKPLEIAIKMFQPIDPGEDNNEAQVAYKLAKNKWYRSPAQSACRAYITARGEVRVLYWVAHPNVVPFIGLCQSPLSIIMPRAPRGALDSILSDFKRSGDKVNEETARMTILQIGKALDYLHGHRIIYRDLKSENVLVWTFPQPFAKKVDLINVDVKLTDYGISRSSFQGGSKGFGGTEGFMAPEIIRFNGEEEYTEKVDIFSFGMLLYELISLRQPFDGFENVKESILEGMRPALTQRDCDTYPLYLLDLMVVCWNHTPKDRPTASQIVSIASAPEFTIIRDVVSLGSVTNVVAALGLHYGAEKEVWASCSTGGIYCLKVSSKKVESCHCFEFISGVVTAMCHIDSSFVWMGDTMGKVHVLCISDYNKTLECDFESLVGYVGAVVSIKFLQSVVAVAFSSGRLFLCDKVSAQPLTELGKSPVIHCLSCRITEAETVELWTGERAGQMTVYTIKDGCVISQEIINHYEPHIEAVEVLLIEGHSNQELLFSYVYPGSVIYGWDCSRREMIARLDVGKLLPVKESIEEELNSKPLQVTVLKVALSEVYVGTNWGFVFLADVKRLRPITFFRPFEQDVRSFWVFRDADNINPIIINPTSDQESDGGLATMHSSTSSSNISSALVMNGSEKDSGIKKQDDLDEIRGSGASPTPSQSDINKSNLQIVLGIGKGFSNLIDKSIGLNFGNELKQRRKAFATLWHMHEAADP